MRSSLCCDRTIWEYQVMADKLGIGADFPTLSLNLVGGGMLELPAGLDGNYKVILFYRGHW